VPGTTILARRGGAACVLAPALLGCVVGCGSPRSFAAPADGGGLSDAPSLPEGANDAGASDSSASCDWPSSAVTESAAALYLAGTGYAGAPRVYEPDGSISDVSLLSACLKVSPDAGTNGLYEAVFSYAVGGPREVYVPIGAENAFSPPPLARGQTELFAGQSAFGVAFDGAPITWQLGTQTVTASASSPPCAPNVFVGPPACVGECGPTALPACGDGTCTAPEDCRTCPTDCDCTGLSPIFDCVRPRADGSYEAWFGYRATSNGGLTYGPANFFSPGNEGRGQPEWFAAGEHHLVTVAGFSGPSLGWSLAGNTAQATPDGPACPPCAVANCTAPGVSCAGDSCVIPCGDDWCAGDLGEGPWTCPDDCVCAGCQVAIDNSCGSPSRCGTDWECGSGSTFGVFVDCGSCPGGATCVDHVCQ
jgi:hypothetical protein